jgi:hypothetical protein
LVYLGAFGLAIFVQNLCGLCGEKNKRINTKLSFKKCLFSLVLSKIVRVDCINKSKKNSVNPATLIAGVWKEWMPILKKMAPM